MSEQQYTGSCQCGAVTFEAALDLDKTYTCNCSRCQRMGFVLAFAPRDKVVLKSGAGNLTEFTFNRHLNTHSFCKTCGIQAFALTVAKDGTLRTAVNVNCLDGVDPRALKSKPVDGRSF